MISLGGFVTFIRTNGVDASVLPDNSPSIQFAYDMATDIVNTDINLISPNVYTVCVYNLGLDNIINYAEDQLGRTFFADLRRDYKCLDFVPGLINETHDETTGTSYQAIDALKNLSLSNLQNLKTPYGRRYLQLAMQYGGLVVGV